MAIKSIGIIGLGAYLPEKILTNFDLEKMVETSDEWIRTRTGIQERRIAGENESTSYMAVEASKEALKDAKLSPEDIDLIIVATATPDYYFPSTACVVQDKLGAKNAVAFDISAACSGFLYALSVANSMLAAGTYKNALVIGSETLSRITDWKDRSTCILFGDGAGAAVIGEVDKGYGIIDVKLGSDGSEGKNLTAPSCFIPPDEIEKRANGKYNTIWMNGSEVFKFAVKIVETTAMEILSENNMTIDDVEMMIPHQANIRIIESASERLKISKEKIFGNIHKYGNTSAASVPIALYEAYKEGKIKKGDRLLLVGFGAGLTWGSALVKWAK